MESKILREKFLKFFEDHGHKILPSASLVPENDPSVLFTTAGMQQFKRYYLNPDEVPASKITTSQKCLRTGDISEVGDDSHLSFFEMLGNFSFDPPAGGFKKEAIELAWEFLTKELEIDKSRIYATYFSGNNEITEDLESKEILEKIEGLKEIKPQGFEDNFWSLGTEGSPGGPTVEFYVDDIEVWNLVFNEYEYRNNQYQKSEYRGVDTGMGLERLLAVINKVNNVYETDLFLSIIKRIEEISGKKYSENKKAFRLISDHLKAAVFAINDEVLPSNKDAGYVIRRLIRRAIVKGKEIGIDKNFTTNIAAEVLKTYDGVYQLNKELIISELEKEEAKFRTTLERGLKEFAKQKENLNGKIAFDLYQTYGFPWEMTAELAEENKINIDKKEFEEEFKKHQELSRTASAGMFKGGLQSGGEKETKFHTATHLLLATLRQVLGNGVYQKGSNINAERLRFDFSYSDKMTDEQIKKVEDLVNEKIQEDLPVEMREMSLDEAKNSGAMGIFDTKYGDLVKVYSIGDFSKEICGGPHVKRTGELGHFKITKEESSSAGVRRIKAILE